MISEARVLNEAATNVLKTPTNFNQNLQNDELFNKIGNIAPKNAQTNTQCIQKHEYLNKLILTERNITQNDCTNLKFEWKVMYYLFNLYNCLK